jgi:hypothetical protein
MDRWMEEHTRGVFRAPLSFTAGCVPAWRALCGVDGRECDELSTQLPAPIHSASSGRPIALLPP